MLPIQAQQSSRSHHNKNLSCLLIKDLLLCASAGPESGFSPCVAVDVSATEEPSMGLIVLASGETGHQALRLSWKALQICFFFFSGNR